MRTASFEYEMIPRESFLVIRGCAKCGRKTHFINTEKFRVNANGNKLDVWLIYQCEECKHTLNLAIYERQKVSSIPKEEYQRFLDNDEELARKYGTDLQLFQKNKAEIDFERVSVDFVKKYDTKENGGSGAATADFFLCECCPCREIAAGELTVFQNRLYARRCLFIPYWIFACRRLP